MLCHRMLLQLNLFINQDQTPQPRKLVIRHMHSKKLTYVSNSNQ